MDHFSDKVEVNVKTVDVRRMWKKILLPLTFLATFCGAYHDGDIEPKSRQMVDEKRGRTGDGRRHETSFSGVCRVKRVLKTRLLQANHLLTSIGLCGMAAFMSVYTLLESSHLQFTIDYYVVILSWLIQAAANNVIMFWNCSSKNRFRRFMSVLVDYVEICEAKGVVLPWKRVRFVAGVIALFSLVLVGGIGVTFTVINNMRNELAVNPQYVSTFQFIFDILYQICGVYNVVIIVFSPSLFAIICYFISCAFAELTEEFKRVTQRNDKVDGTMLTLFHRRHAQICLLVDIIDDAFSPIIGLAFTTNTVSVLFLLYYVTTHQYDHQYQLHQYEAWLVFYVTIIFAFALSAAMVHEKAHSLRRHVHELQTETFDPEITQVQVLFLARLDGCEIGMTVMGCFVITKERVLTVISALITYFTILLQFKDTCAQSDKTASVQFEETTDIYTTLVTA